MTFQEARKIVESYMKDNVYTEYGEPNQQQQQSSR